MLKEFKEFAMRGNVMDLAVGVVIGGALAAIITSFVDDIIMPLFSLIFRLSDISGYFIALDGNSYNSIAEAKNAGAATLNYGNLIQVIVNFLIISIVLFAVVKSINKASIKEKKPASKKCSFCQMEISAEATKCPYCTAELYNKI